MQSAEAIVKEIEKYKKRELVDRVRHGLVFNLEAFRNLDKIPSDLMDHLAPAMARIAYLNDFDEIEVLEAGDIMFRSFDYDSMVGVGSQVRAKIHKKTLGRFVLNLLADHNKIEDELGSAKCEINKQKNLILSLANGSAKISICSECDGSTYCDECESRGYIVKHDTISE